MAGYHELAFEELDRQITCFSTVTAAVLRQMAEQFGAEDAFYAAFVFIALEKGVQQFGYRYVEAMTLAEIKHYTFFAVTEGTPAAQALFVKAFECYQADCGNRFASAR